MIELGLNMEGLRSAAEFLGQRAPKNLESVIKEAVAGELAKVLNEIAHEAQQVAPVRTGRLRRSIFGFVGDTLVTGPQSGEGAFGTAADPSVKVARASNLVAGQGGTSGSIKGRIVALAFYSQFVHEEFLAYLGSPVQGNGTIKPRVDGTGGKFIEGVIVDKSRYLVGRIAAAMTKAIADAGAKGVKRGNREAPKGIGKIKTSFGDDIRTREV
jgi:hypothetical protein